MRRLRSTLILLVVLAGLVGYIYYDSKKPAASTDTKEKAFSGVTADAIEELQIKAADGDVSHVQKTGDQWKLVDPVKADADGNEVSSVATSLASLDVDRVVDENPSNLKEYGLDPARVEVSFRTRGQKDFKKLLVGERTPTGNDLYARLPDQKRVFLINSFNDSTFNKNTFALREKKILKIERDKVDGLGVSDGTNSFQFAKSGTEWKIVKPIMARAEFGQLEGIVERLSTAQMQGLTADSSDDLKKYGLDKPTATMTLSMGAMKTTLTLGKTENAVVFAKDSTRPMIFTVAPTLKTDVIKTLSDYRRKDLFDGRSFNANKVEIHRGADVVTLEKTTKDGKDTWKKADGKDADTGKVEDLLGKLTALRAQSFDSASNAALKSPAMTVTLTYDKTKMETVTLAKAGNDVFGARADEPGTAKLETMPFDDVMKAVDGVK
jgi:Domain of unknown function (DUF4340)